MHIKMGDVLGLYRQITMRSAGWLTTPFLNTILTIGLIGIKLKAIGIIISILMIMNSALARTCNCEVKDGREGKMAGRTDQGCCHGVSHERRAFALAAICDCMALEKHGQKGTSKCRKRLGDDGLVSRGDQEAKSPPVLSPAREGDGQKPSIMSAAVLEAAIPVHPVIPFTVMLC